MTNEQDKASNIGLVTWMIRRGEDTSEAKTFENLALTLVNASITADNAHTRELIKELLASITGEDDSFSRKIKLPLPEVLKAFAENPNINSEYRQRFANLLPEE